MAFTTSSHNLSPIIGIKKGECQKDLGEKVFFPLFITTSIPLYYFDSTSLTASANSSEKSVCGACPLPSISVRLLSGADMLS